MVVEEPDAPQAASRPKLKEPRGIEIIVDDVRIRAEVDADVDTICGAPTSRPALAKAGGEFKLGNGRYCYPLTVTDQALRYLLACEALDSTREDPVIEAFQRLFVERGLPAAIRSDDGLPFASPNGLYNLSKLSVVVAQARPLRLERIKPGQPQQNGRHERMHLTLKTETTRPPGANSLQQQARFDAFISEFNAERPHEALDMRCPADVYEPHKGPIAACRSWTIPSTTGTSW